MASFKPGHRHFTKAEEAEMYRILDTFPKADDVYLTEELMTLCEIVISILIVRNGWMDPRRGQKDCNDLVQEAWIGAPKILQNIWLRRNNIGNPIRNLFSYLCTAFQHKMQDYFRKAWNQNRYFEEMTDYCDTHMEELEVDANNIGYQVPNFYHQLFNREIYVEIIEKLNEIEFRTTGRKWVACQWLLHHYKTTFKIVKEDLWPFEGEFSEVELTFIFDYVDVTLKHLLFPFNKDRKSLDFIRVAQPVSISNMKEDYDSTLSS